MESGRTQNETATADSAVSQSVSNESRAGGTGQLLRALTAFVDDPGSVLSTHVVAQNYL